MVEGQAHADEREEVHAVFVRRAHCRLRTRLLQVAD